MPLNRREPENRSWFWKIGKHQRDNFTPLRSKDGKEWRRCTWTQLKTTNLKNSAETFQDAQTQMWLLYLILSTRLALNPLGSFFFKSYSKANEKSFASDIPLQEGFKFQYGRYVGGTKKVKGKNIYYYHFVGHCGEFGGLKCISSLWNESMKINLSYDASWLSKSKSHF